MWSETPRRVERWSSEYCGRHWVGKHDDPADAAGLPPVVEYTCKRTDTPILVDGRLDEDVWSRAAWSGPFPEISGKTRAVDTYIALLWDDTYLYAGYKVEDPDVRGTMGLHHDHIYVQDDDVEIFVHGDGCYYEMGINPINNGYQIRWVWMEELVKAQKYDELERCMSLDDHIYYRRREGEKLGRVGDMNFSLSGLRTAVHVDGVLNQPHIQDTGWTVEFAIPWAGLQSIAGSLAMPPKAGDTLRITGYRAHHDRTAQGQKQWDSPLMPWEQQSWSVMGNSNIHNPERWTRVTFSDDHV